MVLYVLDWLLKSFILLSIHPFSFTYLYKLLDSLYFTRTKFDCFWSDRNQFLFKRPFLFFFSLFFPWNNNYSSQRQVFCHCCYLFCVCTSLSIRKIIKLLAWSLRHWSFQMMNRRLYLQFNVLPPNYIRE